MSTSGSLEAKLRSKSKKGKGTNSTAIVVGVVSVLFVAFAVFLAIGDGADGPSDAQVLFRTASQLHRQGKSEEAIAMMTDMVEAYPKYALAHYNLAIYLRNTGDYEGAELHNKMAIELKPKFPEAYINLGISLEKQRRRSEARDSYNTAKALRPNFFEAYNSLAILEQDEGNIEEARRYYKQALDIRSDDAIRVKLAMLLPPMFNSKEHPQKLRKQFRRNVDKLLKQKHLRVDRPQFSVGMVPFYLAYNGFNNRDLMEKLYQLYQKASPSLFYTAEHLQRFATTKTISHQSLIPKGYTEKKIRVGIFSSHLRGHSIGKLMRGLVKYIPRERLHITVIFPAQKFDSISQFFKDSADDFVKVPGNLEPARQRIAALRLHVILFADIGMDSLGYYIAYSRLAPVQMVTHGHPITTGIKTIDYFVSFEHYEEASAQEFYTEKLVRIKGCSSRYLEPGDKQNLKSREAFGFSLDDHIYLSPQSLFKFHPEFDFMLLNILRSDPKAKIALIKERHAGWGEKLIKRLRKELKSGKVYIAKDSPKNNENKNNNNNNVNDDDDDIISRIVFLDRVIQQTFLNYLAIADVVLDPHPFGGDTSSREALFVNAPIVTLPSVQLPGRYTQGFYKEIGVLDLIASSPENYVDLAIRLTHDKDFHDDVVARIKANSDKLFNDQVVVEAWEQLFVESVQKVVTDLPV